jgi:hypothetical protein
VKPTDSKSETEPDRSWTYAEIAAQCIGLRDQLAARRLRIHDASALGKVIQEAIALAREWDHDSARLVRTPMDEAALRRLICAIHANRVSQAVLAVVHDPAAVELLKRIVKNPLNLSDREQSKAKDALWEIELLSKIRSRGLTARLAEPPDIVVQLDEDEVGIACKKVYSERGVEAQVRKGCVQLSSFKGGVVALNLDQLVPFDKIVSVKGRSEASDTLHRINVEFLRRNASRLARFIQSGRCDGLLLCVTAEADLHESRVRINAVSETMIWTIDGAPRGRVDRLRQFGERLNADVGTLDVGVGA